MADIVFYKDLGLDFTPHPVTGDVRPITNETAIRRSLMNLIKTRKGTNPYNLSNPTIDTKVQNQQGPCCTQSPQEVVGGVERRIQRQPVAYGNHFGGPKRSWCGCKSTKGWGQMCL